MLQPSPPESGDEARPGPSRPASAGEVPAQAGPYRIEGEVARGGMGVVFRAYDLEFRRFIAVKVLQERYRGIALIESRFLAEARLTGQLQHPGIPPAYQVGQLPDGSPFFALKLVQGRTLRVLLTRRRHPTDGLPHLLEVFEQVCQAVAYAHGKGVIHRDLKPGNVMLGSYGEVLVMDWGLAKFLPRPGVAEDQGGGEDEAGPQTLSLAGPGSAAVVSQAGVTAGTPAYMPPEQARGEVGRLNERCDVFGLGAVLCEILTGQPPYEGAAGQVRLQARLGHLAPAYYRLEACGADPELVALARACLAPEPEARPPDARAVAERVTAYRARVGEETLQRPALGRTLAQDSRPLPRARAKSRRWAGAAAVAVTVLLLALAGLIGRGGFSTGARSEPTVEEELEQTDAALRQGRWEEAQASLGRARICVDSRTPEALRQRLAQGQADLDLARALDAIWLHRLLLVASPLAGEEVAPAWRGAGPAYAEAFRAAGLAPEEGAAALAERIQRSALRTRLVAALDDWLVVDRPRRPHLLTILRQADGDGLLTSLREALVNGKADRLAHLLRAPEVAALDPPPLSLLSADEAGEAGLAALRQARRRHATEFWVSFVLANRLLRHRPAWPREAVACCCAALAARPKDAVVHNNLGLALEGAQLLEGALQSFRTATHLDPGCAAAHCNLGGVLKTKGDLDGALQAMRRGHELGAQDLYWPHPSRKWVAACEILREAALPNQWHQRKDGDP